MLTLFALLYALSLNAACTSSSPVMLYSMPPLETSRKHAPSLQPESTDTWHVAPCIPVCSISLIRCSMPCCRFEPPSPPSSMSSLFPLSSPYSSTEHCKQITHRCPSLPVTSSSSAFFSTNQHPAIPSINIPPLPVIRHTTNSPASSCHKRMSTIAICTQACGPPQT